MNRQIIIFKNTQRERQNTKEMTNQNTIQLALDMKMYQIRTNMNKLPSKQTMWRRYIQRRKGKYKRKTTVHIEEIARAIQVLQKNKLKISNF